MYYEVLDEDGNASPNEWWIMVRRIDLGDGDHEGVLTSLEEEIPENLVITKTDKPPTEAAKAVSVVAGLALIGSAIAAYEGYSVAISTKDFQKALIEAGLNCAVTAPLMLVGGPQMIPLVAITCGAGFVGALVGIGSVLTSKSVPSVIFATRRIQISTMLGGLLRGFGGGPLFEAMLANSLDPITAQRLYEAAYETIYGDVGELYSIKQKLKTLERYFVVPGDKGERIVTMSEVMKRIDGIEEQLKVISSNYNNVRTILESLRKRLQSTENVAYAGVGLGLINFAAVNALEKKKANVKDLAELSKRIDENIDSIKQRIDKFSGKVDRVENVAYTSFGLGLANFAAVNKLGKEKANVKDLERLSREVDDLKSATLNEVNAIKSKLSDVENLGLTSLGIALMSYAAINGLSATIKPMVREEVENVLREELSAARNEEVGVMQKISSIEARLGALEERVIDCCAPLPYDDAVEESKSIRDRTRKLRKLAKGIPPLLLKLLYGSPLLNQPVDLPGSLMNALGMIGLAYSTVITALSRLLL